MIIVFDTNVLISALQFGQRHGSPVRALEKAMRSDVIATSDQMLFETYRILTEKFNWQSDRVEMALSLVLARSISVDLKGTVHICRDPNDDMFLECAELARADFLIAGDKDLLDLRSHKGTRIVTPRFYLDHVRSPR